MVVTGKGKKGATSGGLRFYQRIASLFSLFAFFIVVASTAAVVYFISQYYQEASNRNAQTSLEQLSRSIFQSVSLAMKSGISDHVHEALEQAKQEGYVDNLELYISQKILDQYRPRDVAPPQPVEINRVFASGEDAFDTYKNDRGERFARFIRPFKADDECLACHFHNVSKGDVLGAMDMIASLEKYDKLAEQSIQKIIIIVASIVSTVALIMLAFSRRLIFKPLEELESASKRLAQNATDPSVRLMTSVKNEFGVVATQFNIYIDTVLQINRRLEEEEAKTKDLLENRESEIERRTAEVHKLNKELSHYIDVVDQNVITTRTDTRGVITYASTAFCRISGFTKEEAVGHPHNIVRHPDMPREIFVNMWDTIKRGEVWRGEVKNRTKSGGFYWVNTVIAPQFADNTEIVGYVAVRHDITLQKELEETLQKLGEVTRRSHTDALTGIMNRLRINELLQMEIDRAERYGGDLAVALLDIDHFKKINDTYGHLIGDEVLKKLASNLTTKMRKTDLAGRWGGEEFLMVLVNTPKAGALRKMDQFRALIERENFAPVPKVTVSIGISIYQDGDTLESLVGRSDVALYLAKESGRNRVEISPEAGSHTIEIDLDKDLKK
ncbi:MAG: diguanylate cyclase [Helicobacteraceae bacterium]|jgi:diguanylate cyclase (GGDEF)-like protein/PAS domain S-box-containing protein|nr:diguanylate cyclase [Helicobacteraceae bacterium]